MRLLLYPFALLYGLGVRLRNALFDNRFLASTGFQVPVISVGNLTAGGTGKTPHVEYLAGLLHDTYNVAILSRGYRRRTRDFRMVSTASAVHEVGDEPLQMKGKFPDIRVAVDRHRVHGVEELMKLSPQVECVLLDDAFQHRAIRPGCSILLVDFMRPPEKDHLLPAGMLREPASGKRRANIILVTKSPPDLKPIELREYVKTYEPGIGQHLYFTTMRYGPPIPVFPDSAQSLLPDLNPIADDPGSEDPGQQPAGILIVTGVAGKNALLDYATELCGNIREIRFGDHHRYRQKDLEMICSTFLEMQGHGHEDVFVITTEKDAVKIRELEVSEELRRTMFAIPVEVHFLNEDKQNFDRQIQNYVRDNKRSSILHQGTAADYS